jgi:hypothetical protein
MTVVSSWGCLVLGASVDCTGSGSQCFPRVPHRVPPPALHIGGQDVQVPAIQLQALTGVTTRAMAQMKPAISRAMAVVATTFGLPAAIRCR